MRQRLFTGIAIGFAVGMLTAMFLVLSAVPRG
jgi:tetrahydromethanopterin S-methyltransferase subunit F